MREQNGFHAVETKGLTAAKEVLDTAINREGDSIHLLRMPGLAAHRLPSTSLLNRWRVLCWPTAEAS